MKHADCIAFSKAAFGALALALPLAAASAGSEPPPGLTHYRCYICHSDREPLVGPAFLDIAETYRTKPDAVSFIASEIRSGVRGGGPWHMPPHPEVTQAEARAMARYIMSLQPATADKKQADRR